MNSATVCGRLGGDPIMTTTNSGRSVAKFSIADDCGKDQDGKDITQWFNCRAYDRTAELIHEHFGKGKPIWVHGHLTAHSYKRNDGEFAFSLDLQVMGFEFVPLGNAPRKEEDPQEPQMPATRDAAPAAPATTTTAAGDVNPEDLVDPFADQ